MWGASAVWDANVFVGSQSAMYGGGLAHEVNAVSGRVVRGCGRLCNPGAEISAGQGSLDVQVARSDGERVILAGVGDARGWIGVAAVGGESLRGRLHVVRSLQCRRISVLCLGGRSRRHCLRSSSAGRRERPSVARWRWLASLRGE